MAAPLPPLAATLVRLIGPEMALRLIELHGGTRVFVPLTEGRRRDRAVGRKLGLALSAEAEAALVAEFGGGMIEVPLCKAWRAVQYRRAGMTCRDAARRLGTNERAVRKYLAEAEQVLGQLELGL